MAADPWGGSEELWSRTALDLIAQGWKVSASVPRWVPPHKRIMALAAGGVEVCFRASRYSLWKRAWRKLAWRGYDDWIVDVPQFLFQKNPVLAVLSTGTAVPPVELIELCIRMRIPFVTIGQANWEAWWPDDEQAARYRRSLPAARRCYFVSRANLQLLEKQIGCALTNAEVIWNPFNVDYNFSPAWPSDETNVLFACVGRLHPPSKGQDLLLEALATPIWMQRSWRLTFYGEGRMKNTIERLVLRLGLIDRVVFAGHAAVEDIWASNHLLVLPSRYEGLPLVLVEAMLCGRPAVATEIAGHPDLIEEGITGFLAEAPTVSSLLNALERFWARRAEAKQLGEIAANNIRRLVPPDPVSIFSEKIQQLASTNV
jgi:glycosyltransferase involved in cell wall biosynthesis